MLPVALPKLSALEKPTQDDPDEIERKETAAKLAEARTVRQGADAWASLSKSASYDSWCLIGRALLVGRKITLARSGANRAIGHVYSKAFNAWAKQYGFAAMTASTRSDAITLAENELAITAWRDGLPRRQRRRLINPQSVVKRWQRTMQHGKGKCPTDLRRDALAAWKRFTVLVRALPSNESTQIWQAVSAEAAAHV